MVKSTILLWRARNGAVDHEWWAVQLNPKCIAGAASPSLREVRRPGRHLVDHA
jgi:hypothetical protein